MLSRYEEWVAADRDALGRVPDSSQLLSRAGLDRRPLVDEYADVLWVCATTLWPALEKQRQAFRVALSHDVDDISVRDRPMWTVARSLGADIAQRRDLALAGRRGVASVYSKATSRIHPADPYFQFSDMMDMSERHNFRSAFYFVAQNERHHGDPPYLFGATEVTDLIGAMLGRGHEVGCHGSLRSYNDPGRLSAEAALVREAIAAAGSEPREIGGRQHCLRWSNPITWRCAEAAGLAYDATLAFHSSAGFRCGTSHAYQVFDLGERRPLNLVERPLIVMEKAITHNKGKSLEALQDEIVGLARTCKAHDGTFSLLWHNAYLIDRRFRRAYAEVLETLAAI
jgi:hypothetical protein